MSFKKYIGPFLICIVFMTIVAIKFVEAITAHRTVRIYLFGLALVIFLGVLIGMLVSGQKARRAK